MRNELITTQPVIAIGTSGWSYDHWRDIVYPSGVPSRERLDYYTKLFSTVEVNNTYYRWPKDEVFAGWRERTPDDFILTIKASGGLTHRGKLKNPERGLDIMNPGLARLGEKMGVLLAQLPSNFGCDLERLEGFLKALPGWYKTAIEFRHESWHTDEVFRMLEQYNVAYCIMSGAHLPCILRATAGFVYVRLHGPDENNLYGGSYSDDDLHWWAEHIFKWHAQGREVFTYFNNDGGGNAVRNAQRLIQIVSDGFGSHGTTSESLDKIKENQLMGKYPVHGP